MFLISESSDASNRAGVLTRPILSGNSDVEVMDTSREKDPRLLHHLRTFMKNHPKDSPLPARILVFALYKKEATRLEYTIRNAGYKVAGLHGDLSQDARFKALDAFKEGKVNVLVATDVAARGLDIPDVQLVINVTFPLTTGESTWIHHVYLTNPRSICR